MKLKKIKLINWHIFRNNTIEVNGNILITGENASGKSTLMDAIYYVLSGGDSKHFNKAANEGGQRSLETYMRGKIGSERNPYLRPETDCVSYIVLEYYDDKNDYNMVLGSEMEIISSSRPREHFFVINDYKINDIDFIKDKEIIEFRSFKSNAKANKLDLTELPDSIKGRLKILAKDIFKLEDYKRYSELLENAICFRPISEVSTFVNSFLLEESNINLDSLREEIRSYQNIHKMLIKEKEKIEMLKDFTPKAEKYLDNLKRIKYLNVLKIDLRIERLNNIINRDNIELKRLEDEYNTLKIKEESLRENSKRLNIEINQLENNEAYKALLNKKQNLEKLKNELSFYKQKLEEFSTLLAREERIAKNLKLNHKFVDDYKEKDFGLMLAHFENYNDELNELENKTRDEIANINYEIRTNNSLKASKEIELDNLKKGLNNYEKDVYNLIEIAKSAIRESNPKEQDICCKPLCEYIEIIDEKWRDALEGYLNTRKFNLIISPKYYDVVSVAYDRYKKEREVYVAGIVNTEAIPHNKTLDNSLMTKIKVENKYAYRYANYLLGDLICVDDVKELKYFDSSITKDAMVYKNYVQKAINPKAYRVPYIGADSRKRRIEILTSEINEIIEKNKELDLKLSTLKSILDVIGNSNISTLLKTENYWIIINNTNSEIERIKEEIIEDEKNSGLLEITGRIESAKKNLYLVESDISAIESKIRENNISQGQLNQKLQDNKNQLIFEKDNFDKSIKELETTEYDNYKIEYTVNGWLNGDKIEKDLDSIQHYNYKINFILTETMQKYSSTYKASLIPIIENIKDYINEYYDLINRGVVEYELKAREAYEIAEGSFKEDFISKLKEKIEKSQRMLDKINKNLALHPFGNDEEKYKFDYQPTKDSEFYNYYRIIMSGKFMESKDLFTEILDEKDNSFMKDLFGKISMEIDSEKAQSQVERYLDYRNYMNYDIKITNKYGDDTLFSKINKEKSGGETQTPFYIVMASCFDELMNKDSNKINSTCQVVFDEAFNNMDESRIKSLMEFYKKLNIQIIIIVPSNRISAISPYMDTLVGITKVNNHPYINVVVKDE